MAQNTKKDEFGWLELAEKLNQKATFLKMGEIVTIKYGKCTPKTEERTNTKDGSKYMSTHYELEAIGQDNESYTIAVGEKTLKDIIRMYKLQGQQSVFRYIRGV